MKVNTVVTILDPILGPKVREYALLGLYDGTESRVVTFKMIEINACSPN